MIVESKDFVRSSLKDFLSDITSDNVEERYRFLSYYEGMAQEMEKDLAKYFPIKSLEVPMIVQNVTSKLINARAIAYKNTPARTNEDYLDSVKDLDQAMITAERLTYLLGSHLIKSRYNEDKKVIEYDQIIEFEPIFEPRSREPFAYIYPVYNHGQARENEIVYAYWSAEEHFLIHQNGKIESVNEENVNPYGVLPFTICHRHPYTTDFMRNGATDIVNANLMINVLMTELGLAMRLQALGQPVISGVDQMSKVSLGVDKPMVLPEGASFNFVSPGGNLKDYIESIRFYVDSVAYNNNLKVKWSVGRESFVSGEALKMAEIDLEVHGINISDEYSVDFSEPRFPLTAKEEREQWNWEWANELSSPKDWLRKYNPDLSEEELDEMVAEMQPEAEAPAPTLGEILSS